MGDPAGIGPEIIVKALSIDKIRNSINPVLFGNRIIFDSTIKRLKSDLKIRIAKDIDDLKIAGREVKLIDCDIDTGSIKPGKISEKSGRASIICIKKAVKSALSKKIDAIVTAPICKDSINRAGFFYPGHTELLAELTGTKRFAMMFVGKNMKIVLVTIHIAIKEVSGSLTRQGIINTVFLLVDTLKRYFNIVRPCIGVAGLNPHAGESGIFGNEEEKVIKPAIKYIKIKKNIRIEGPIPADTLFYERILKKFDAVVCMYHDQGLIPFKMLNFDNGVNVTIGLPVIRTSPDHGVAFDIAGKGVANPSSLISAINLANNMAKINNGNQS